MLNYPVKLIADGDGWMAQFVDIPEALTSAPTKEEALEMAHDALETAMEFYFEDGRIVPMPSKVKRGQESVELPTSIMAKVLLLNEMLTQKVKPAELARRLGTRPQDVNRIVDLHHATKIDTLADAFRALGKSLCLNVA
jgi:antitoxin HicB